MTTRGDLNKQLTRALDTIKTQGYRFEEVIPDEIRDHFHDMAALKEARTYIKSIETREADLRAEKVNLLSKLRAKQTEIDDQPAEFKALQIDLQQAQHRVAYYKGLSDDAQARAERYQEKLTEACRLQTTADDDARKIQRLERNLTDREVAVRKLLNENRNMVDLYENQHKLDQALIEEKENTIIAMIEHSRQLEAEKTEEMEDHEKVSGAHDSLIDCLEQEYMTANQAFNRNSAKLLNEVQLSNQLYSAIASELMPLGSFYRNALCILDVYQVIFSTLSTTNGRAVLSIPPCIDDAMDFASDHLSSWQHVSADLHAHNSVQGQVLHQVDDMFGVAAHTYITLEGLKESVSGFLDRLRSERAASSSSTRSEVVRNSQASMTSTPTIPPSESNGTSLKNLVKRFAIAARS
jgi:hypothetical protein